MRGVRTRKYILDHDLYVLVFGAALVYYLYQHLIIHTAVTFPQGACLYPFWLAGGLFSPFVLFSITVILLISLGIAIAIRDLYSKKLNWIRWLILVVFFIVMAFWVRALLGMNAAFEYEKGNKTFAEYYQTEKEDSPFNWYTEEVFFTCEKDT